MMQLDDVVSTLTTGPRVQEAMERSIRWLDRCMSANTRPQQQQVFGIIQGGLDAELRDECLKEMISRDCVGYAIGGLSGGEAKDQFWRVVAQCAARLPPSKPRYCMGVGYPEDIVVCIALGVDMFDCVYPCRTARFGTALTSRGLLQLSKQRYAKDTGRLDESCNCRTCQTYTRAYLHTVAGKGVLGARLLTYHNLAYLIQLTRDARSAIQQARFPEYVQQFFALYHPDRRYPQWIVDALGSVGIALLQSGAAAESE